MSEPSWDAVRQQVYDRAKGCCEYCLTCEDNTGQVRQIDHIDPTGDDSPANLALACWTCNNAKRRATHAPDPISGALVPLFNPRTQRWNEHFAWTEQFSLIAGLTPTGRATIERLKMNRGVLIVARKRWIAGGYHPPDFAQDE